MISTGLVQLAAETANGVNEINSGAASQFLFVGAAAEPHINVAATVMLAVCTALVLFMVPGLAFFYGGLVRRKNVGTIMAQCFISMAIVTAIWICGGFSLAFGSDTPGGFIGDIKDYVFFRNIIFTDGWNTTGLVVNATLADGVPFILFFLFQLAFAIITPALVVGAFADRLSWRGYIIFNVLFTIFIYIPVCHWIWGGGFLAQNGVVDWAGGIVIHVTCGFAAIASVIVLRRRSVMKKETTAPHSLPLVAIGAGILFFGWFGFNVGGSCFVPTVYADYNAAISASSTDALAQLDQHALMIGVTAFVNSFLGMCGAMLIWMTLDFIVAKRTSFASILTAGVAGLATVTPGAGFVPMWAGLVFGLAGGFVCYWMCKLNHKVHFDDALEVWPVHGMGGVTGGLLVGAFATTLANPVLLGSTQHIGNSLGSGYLFGMQLGAICLVATWTLVFGLAIFGITLLTKDRMSTEEQIEGLDHVLFHEDAYASAISVEAVMQGEGNELTGHRHASKLSRIKSFKKPKTTSEVVQKVSLSEKISEARVEEKQA